MEICILISGTDIQRLSREEMVAAMYNQTSQTNGDHGALNMDAKDYPRLMPTSEYSTEQQNKAQVKDQPQCDLTTSDGIELVYGKLVEVKDKCLNSRTPMMEMARIKDKQIQELTSKCARFEDDVRCKREELEKSQAGLCKIMNITQKVDDEFSGMTEQQTFQVDRLREKLKDYEAFASSNMGHLNRAIQKPSIGLAHGSSVSQSLANELGMLRGDIVQERFSNSILQERLHASEEEAKRLTLKLGAAQEDMANMYMINKQLANMRNFDVKLREEREKTNQEKQIQTQKKDLKARDTIIEHQGASLEQAIEALGKVPPGVLTPDYKPLQVQVEIDQLKKALDESHRQIEKLQEYITKIEKQQSTELKEVPERTSKQRMSLKKAEEVAREWRKVPLETRLWEARRSIIAEDSFLKSLLVGKEEKY
ncbi:hypothetical protein HYALB_00003044 [Hymenoscyphus albidus]|uniref:Uncharacterized protein n=1 Tax=Hymenoscyphus albidus TaxID=595503 RepID=A0A9N9LV94_9HELO|nr:hypothetical protein HYALB_00003044 [Hymenoscyphus albidus]